MNPPLLLCLNVAASVGGSVTLIKKIKLANLCALTGHRRLLWELAQTWRLCYHFASFSIIETNIGQRGHKIEYEL